jgi:hypothetical protein
MLWIPSRLAARWISACWIVVALSGTFASAQPAASLESQLKTIFNLSKVEWAQNDVLHRGTVLTVKNENFLFGSPGIQLGSCAATVQKGNEQAPGSLCRSMRISSGGVFLPPGQRLYITNIKVNLGKDTVTLDLAAFDVDPNTQAAQMPTMKTSVNFVFANGYLAQADAGQIADAIGNDLPPDAGPAQPQSGQQQAGQQFGPPQSGPQQMAPPQSAAPPPEPLQIELGMTEEEVKSILGPPTKANQPAGNMKVYIYHKQITFRDGKVISIE